MAGDCRRAQQFLKHFQEDRIVICGNAPAFARAVRRDDIAGAWAHPVYSKICFGLFYGVP
jgi:hypothetical protein